MMKGCRNLNQRLQERFFRLLTLQPDAFPMLMRGKKFPALVTLQPFRQRPAAPIQWRAQSFPTSKIWKECGIMGERMPRVPPEAPDGGAGGAGVGPYSAVIRKRLPVFVSSVMVLARCGVNTVCSTAKSVGEFSLITVSVPSPWELNTSIVSGLNVAPSHPTPMGRSVKMCPSAADKMIMLFLSRQAANRISFFASSARPAHPPPLLERS